MARSMLKTKISEIYNVDRNTISFNINGASSSIKRSSLVIVSISLIENSFCCGILEAGDTQIGSIPSISNDTKNSLLVDCFNQIHKMIEENNRSSDDYDFHKDIITWSHTINNPLVIALKSEYNTPDMPWKLVSEFFNPNSGNTVCYFIARLVD